MARTVQYLRTAKINQKSMNLDFVMSLKPCPYLMSRDDPHQDSIIPHWYSQFIRPYASGANKAV